MNQQEKIIVNMYEAGKSALKIGQYIGKSKNGVLYTLHKYNIKLRNSSNYDIRRYKVNDNYFSNIDCQEKAYVLGFIMADGCVLDNKTLQITIHKRDILILETIKILLESNCIISQHNKNYVGINIKSIKITEDLLKLGITPRKTKILEMPNIPYDLYTHLIRGYFDGDGSIWFDKQINSYRIQFIGTKKTLKSIKQILQLRDNKLRETRNGSNVYRLNYSGNINVYNILSLLYKDSRIHLKRKYLRYLNCKALKEYYAIK